MTCPQSQMKPDKKPILFPNLPLYASWHLGALSQGIWPFGPGLAQDQNIIPVYKREYDFGAAFGFHVWVHSDYWKSSKVVSDLREWLE